MNERLIIPEGETGVVRVFAVDLDAPALQAFGRRNGTWPLADALGAVPLDPTQAELFSAADLTGVGLVRYLEDGMGIPAEQLAPMRAQLEALQDGILILRSRAFANNSVELRPRAPLRLIASFTEPSPEVQFEPLPSASARGTLTGPAAPPRAPSKRAWWPVWMLVIGLVIILLAIVVAL